MHEVFLLCLVLGAGVLAVQIVLSLFGMGGMLPGDIELGEAGAEDGLDLLSVRTISAGAALFGASGLWFSDLGFPALVTFPLALLTGIAAALSTAYATRQMSRLESDGTLRLENAIGQPATVYLPVPAHRTGFGKVQFQLQGRTVELRAVTEEPVIIPTGAAVIVVAVMDTDTVEVTPPPQLEGVDA